MAELNEEEVLHRMPAIELRGVTKKFATADGGTYTALKDLSMTVEDEASSVPWSGRPGVATGAACRRSSPASSGRAQEGARRRPRGHRHRHVDRVRLPAGRRLPLADRPRQRHRQGPTYRGLGRSAASTMARDWLRRVGLTGFEDRFPHQLSGGMRKRVALAQTLINQPRVLLMDEPFSALDVQTRSIMSTELLHLWDETKPAVIFVTHDLEEAIALADKVVVLTAGPGTIKAEFEIDLPRPRVVQEIRFDPHFVSLYEQIWEALRSEVEEAYARSTRLGEAS